MQQLDSVVSSVESGERPSVEVLVPAPVPPVPPLVVLHQVDTQHVPLEDTVQRRQTLVPPVQLTAEIVNIKYDLTVNNHFKR